MKPYTHMIEVTERDGFNGFVNQPIKNVKARELKKHWLSEVGKFQKNTGYLIGDRYKGVDIGRWIMNLHSEQPLEKKGSNA